MAPRKSKKTESETPSYLEGVKSEVSSKQSKLSMVLGALIILVLGVLVFNYFNKSKPDLGPAQQAEQDVSPEALPGKYTVKENDTLFTIAEKYYQDGYKFTEIAKANNLTNPDMLEKDQVLEIPKVEGVTVADSVEPASTVEPSSSPAPTPEATPTETAMEETATGGGNTTVWGEKIEGDSYTVKAGDWLSTIAGRAYGDIFAFEKIAEANNIDNPDLIEPGTVLKLPR